MNIKTIKISDIRIGAYNPRKKLKPGDPVFEQLKSSIERWSLVEPLVINERTGVLVGGHQRLTVCKELGLKEVQAVVVDLSPEREKLLNLSLNKISGDWDYDKLEDIFREFEAEELTITGFSSAEIEGLIKNTDETVDTVIAERSAREGSAAVPPPKAAAPNAEANAQPIDTTFRLYLSFKSKECAERYAAHEGWTVDFAAGSYTCNVDLGGA